MTWPVGRLRRSERPVANLHGWGPHRRNHTDREGTARPNVEPLILGRSAFAGGPHPRYRQVVERTVHSDARHEPLRDVAELRSASAGIPILRVVQVMPPEGLARRSRLPTPSLGGNRCQGTNAFTSLKTRRPIQLNTRFRIGALQRTGARGGGQNWPSKQPSEAGDGRAVGSLRL